MKSWLFLVVVSVGLYPTSESNSCPVTGQVAEETITPVDPINFKQDIQPILVNRCSPCHFTGGKMYERLPFDSAATLLKPEVKNGILKRIKDEKENELIKRFIEENK